MRIADVGEPRLDRARALATDLQASVGRQFRTEVMTFGESLGARGPGAARRRCPAQRSERRARGAGRPLQGPATGRRRSSSRTAATPRRAKPGRRSRSACRYSRSAIGASTGIRDREIIERDGGRTARCPPHRSTSASRPPASASANSRSSCGSPPTAGRSRRDTVTPRADGAPIHEVFTVSPSADAPTVYAVEIPVGAWRARRREQRAPRARAGAGPPPPRADRRRRARLRAHVPQAGARARSGARDRLGGAQGPERRRPRHVLHPGGSEPRHCTGGGLSDPTGRAVSATTPCSSATSRATSSAANSWR